MNQRLATAARRSAQGVFAVGLLAATTGCSIDKILKVTDSDVATPSSLNTVTALPILLGGAISAFHAAYTGTGNGNESSGQIGYSGLLGDELRSSDTFPTRNEIDQRSVQLDNASNEAQFILLSQARAAADLAAQRYGTLAPDAADRSLANSLGGFATVLFGENYCSGVPFSTLTDAGATEYGQPLTTAAIFQRAAAKFDSALASPGATPEYKNLALVGKARALLNLGQFAEARAVAVQVDPAFEYLIESSETTTGQYNGIYTFNINVKRLTLSDLEGTNGLDYLSANDPRVQYKDTTATAFDGSTNLIVQRKYGSRSAPAVLASGIEAQLIIAEADIQANNYAAALAIMDSLRSDAGIAPLTPALTQAAQVDQLFRERAFWLYLTSHRLGDMRRLVREYSRPTESVFPTGTFFKGGSYGPDVNLPVPEVEKNNPNFHGCIDRNA